MKRILAIGVILLFIGMSVSSSSEFIIDQSPTAVYDGKTLYVGGSGPGNYTKIQDAIDDTSPGDTVFVYDDSSPYMEEIQISKSIHLIGEHRDTTIIDGGEYNQGTIIISSKSVDVQGFTIFGSIDVETSFTNIFNNNIHCLKYECILIQPPFNGNNSLSNNTIINNTLISNTSCIVVWFSHYSLIANNVIYSRYVGFGHAGILLVGNHSKIYNNNIKEGETGIFFAGSNCSIYGNTISNIKNHSLWLSGNDDHYCCNNKIYLNSINSGKYGIYFTWANNNEIFENNFFDNSINAFFINSSNKWQGNYWERPRFLPKLIFGLLLVNSRFIPWFNIDWRPAKEPYDIEV